MTTRQQIENLFDSFFEFPTEDKSHVTSTSCKLFAEHCMKKLGQTVEQEPVGEIYERQHDGSYRAEMVVELPVGTRIYTHPQPKSQPLSEFNLVKLIHEIYTPEVAGNIDLVGALLFAKAIEKAHGIGVE
jgi:hypothetical protein